MKNNGVKIIRNDFLLQKILDNTDFATRANLIIAINSSNDDASMESLQRARNCKAKKAKFACPACIFTYQTGFIPYAHGLGDVDYQLTNRIKDFKYPLYNFVITPELVMTNGVKTMQISDSDFLYNFKSPKRPRYYASYDDYSENQLKDIERWCRLIYKSELPSFTDLDDWIDHLKKCHFSNDEYLPWENKRYAVKRQYKKYRDTEGVTRLRQYPTLEFDISSELEHTDLSVQHITSLEDFVRTAVNLYDPIPYMIQPNTLDWGSMDLSNRLTSNLFRIFARYISLGGFYKTNPMMDHKLYSITTAFRFMRILIRTARFPLRTDPESYKMIAHYVILDEAFKVTFQKVYGQSFNQFQNWTVLEECQEFHVDWQFLPRDLSFES